VFHYNDFIDIVIRFKFKNKTGQKITSVELTLILKVKSIISGINIFFTGKKITTGEFTYKKCIIGGIYNRLMLRPLGAAPPREKSRATATVNRVGVVTGLLLPLT